MHNRLTHHRLTVTIHFIVKALCHVLIELKLSASLRVRLLLFLVDEDAALSRNCLTYRGTASITQRYAVLVA